MKVITFAEDPSYVAVWNNKELVYMGKDKVLAGKIAAVEEMEELIQWAKGILVEDGYEDHSIIKAIDELLNKIGK